MFQNDLDLGCLQFFSNISSRARSRAPRSSTAAHNRARFVSPSNTQPSFCHVLAIVDGYNLGMLCFAGLLSILSRLRTSRNAKLVLYLCPLLQISGQGRDTVSATRLHAQQLSRIRLQKRDIIRVEYCCGFCASL
jgi:hypothetical protein